MILTLICLWALYGLLSLLVELQGAPELSTPVMVFAFLFYIVFGPFATLLVNFLF